MNPIQIHRPGGGPPAPAPGARGGLGSALKRKPGAGLAAGAAVIVVIVALVRKGSGGGAAATTAGASATGTSAFDSTANDLYNSIQPEIDALAQRLSDLQNGLPTPAVPPTTTTLPGHPIQLPVITPIRKLPILHGPPRGPVMSGLTAVKAT